MEKIKKDSSMKKLINYSKRYLIPIFFCIIFATVSAVITIIGPSKIQDLILEISKGVAFQMDMDKFSELATNLLILYAIGVLSSYIMEVITGFVSSKLSRKLRKDLNQKFTKLPLSFYDRSSRGDILSVVSNDVDTISQTLSQSIAYLLNAIVMFVGIIFMMFKTSALLATVVISVSLVGFIFIIIIGAKSQKQFNISQQTLADMNGDIEEVFTNQALVREYNATDFELERFDEINNRLYSANNKSQFLTGLMMPIMQFISNFSYALVFLVGVGVAVSSGSVEITLLGTIITFTLYAQLFSQPLQTFAQSISYIQQSKSAANRVFKYFEESEEEDESNKESLISNATGNIIFDHVNFSYNPEREIIHDFSLNVKAGSKIAIVGPTGAGKTTIVNLLMRFYDINKGSILIDNINTKDSKRENVREQFDMILQDTWLFEGSIRENLKYNDESITDDKILKALDSVGLKHYVETLPNGLDTIINSNLSLSEGQKQELTIARAMLRNAPMLILDEATSNVDTRTELVIQKAMDLLMEGRTSFVIAHRLSTIKNADMILVLNNGDIVETGTHKELLAKGGFYANLYNSQFDLMEQ